MTAISLICASCAQSEQTAVPPLTGKQRLLPESAVPDATTEADSETVELGIEFNSASDGIITAVRFFQSSDDAAPSTATLWTSDGKLIDTVSVPPGPGGWREVPLNRPAHIEAGMNYVVSYRDSSGRYAVDPGAFAEGKEQSSGWLTAVGTSVGDGRGFPDRSAGGAGFYVDVVFEPAGPTLRPVDGGADYYNRFDNSFPGSADFFPVGVWYAGVRSPQDIADDREIALNTYMVLTDDSNLALIQDNGMFAVTEWPDATATARFTVDEADMWAGGGDAGWSGMSPPDEPICIPSEAKCGFSVLAEVRGRIPRGVLAYTNYGKGVTFWEGQPEAERFVNEFQDVVSADNYWWTDPNICSAGEGGALKTHGESDIPESECRLAANYGLTTRRVRSLVQPDASIPVWNFVEIGQPFSSENTNPVTGPKIRAAVWSSIINGARGIVYFAHSFGGPCRSFNLFHDRCGDPVRDDVSAVNHQITRLAPVLNAPFVDGFALSDGPIDLAAKLYDDSLYIIAGSLHNMSSDVTIALTCGQAGTVEVVDENRSIPITDNAFHDKFSDGNAVHIYRIDSTAGCDLP